MNDVHLTQYSIHSSTSYVVFISRSKSVINICRSKLILCKITGLVIEEFAPSTQLIPLHLFEPSIYFSHLQQELCQINISPYAKHALTTNKAYYCQDNLYKQRDCF